MRNFITLMRPRHYLKNVLVFVPIVYSFNLTDPRLFLHTLVCFVVLCLASSGVYATNDISDCEKDKLHPKNKSRPVASGEISKGAAAAFAIFLFLAGFTLLMIYFGPHVQPFEPLRSIRKSNVLIFTGTYVLLNLAYSLRLKHSAVLDCFCVAAGFVLRVFVGGAAIGLYISEWMFLTIAAGSLFMAFGKRRGELLRLGKDGRKVLGGYNLEFLNGAVFACAAVSMIFYALWAMTSVPQMVYTVPLLIFIVCKYLLNTSDEKSYGDPITVIFGDKLLLAAIAVFGILSVVFLYAPL